MDELQSNIFYRTALAAYERSATRRGQMTDLTDAVAPMLAPMTPAEVHKQISELNRVLERRRPGEVRINPERVIARLEAGEPVHLGLNQADLQALFGSNAPFLENDLVMLTLQKQTSGPLIEAEDPTLVNKTVYP